MGVSCASCASIMSFILKPVFYNQLSQIPKYLSFTMNHTNNKGNEIYNKSKIESSKTLLVLDNVINTDNNSVEPMNGATLYDANSLIPVVISPNPENSSSHNGKLDGSNDSDAFNTFNPNLVEGKEEFRKSSNNVSECVKSDAVVIISEKCEKKTDQAKEMSKQLEKNTTSEENSVATKIGSSKERRSNTVVHKQLPIRGKDKNTFHSFIG